MAVLRYTKVVFVLSKHFKICYYSNNKTTHVRSLSSFSILINFTSFTNECPEIFRHPFVKNIVASNGEKMFLHTYLFPSM